MRKVFIISIGVFLLLFLPRSVRAGVVGGTPAPCPAGESSCNCTTQTTCNPPGCSTNPNDPNYDPNCGCITTQTCGCCANATPTPIPYATPTPAPTSGGGGGGGCGAGCTSPSDCAGGLTCDTWDFSPGECWGSSCNAPGPTATPVPGIANCGGACVVNGDCYQYSNPAPNKALCCYTNKQTGLLDCSIDFGNPNHVFPAYCVNPSCPNNTLSGTLCACAANSIPCGQPCAGGCQAPGYCSYVNSTGFNQVSGTPYCIGRRGNILDSPGVNMNYSRDGGNSYYDTTYGTDYHDLDCGGGTPLGQACYARVNPATNQALQTSGFTAGQIIASCPSSTLNVRGVVISSGDPSCSAIDGSTSYLTGTSFSMSPVTTGMTPSGSQTQSGSSYLTWRAYVSSTYSVNGVPPAGFVLQNACWTRNPTAPTSGSGSSVAVNVSNQDTVNWDVGYSYGTPWSQTQGGDVIVKNKVSSLMTSLANPRLFSVNGNGGYPGNVSYGSTGTVPYDFTSDPLDPTYGRNYVSSTNWLVNETGDGLSKDPFATDWYQYFLYQFDLSPQSGATPDYTSPPPVTQPVSRTVPYLVSGDMTTSGDWTIGATDNVIFLVSGNVTIKGKITITPGGFFAMIAKGNITVDPTVGGAWNSSTPDVEGFFVTSPTGSFQTGPSSNAGTERFVGKGSFVAGDFLLQRSLDSVGHNADTAAELFIYNPQLLFTMPEKMKQVKITWREVAP